nr:hypothetical protein HAGR004_33430 [Bdellovibrio sp. HAGR004]
MSRHFLFLIPASALILSGCASGTFKARQQERERLAASSGMYCEFVSGDLFPDLDVELSMSMAKRCDSSRNFTVTNYKNSSDHSGVIYCCATANRSERRAAAPKKSAPATPAKSETADSDAEVVSE